MDKSNLIEVTDKALVVFLVAKGFEIKHIKRDLIRPNRSKIYFSKSSEIQEAVTSFANKNNTVNFSDFVAAEHRVSTLLHMQKSNAF